MTELAGMQLAGLLLIALALASALAIVWGRPAALPYLAQQAQQLEADLRFLRRSGTGMRWAQLQLTAAALQACLALCVRQPLWLVGLVAILVLPSQRLKHARQARTARLETQIDTWLVALANALRATPALGDALASTVSLTTAPLSQELDLILKEHQLGVPLDDAFLHASERVRSRTLSAALLTLRVARGSGGNLSDCLEASAGALREMIRLEGVVRTKTAEGKAQAAVISLLPLPLFGLLAWMDSEFLAPLLSCTLGHVILAVAAVLWSAAILLARRIVQVEV